MVTPAGAIILYICCSSCSQATKERTNDARAKAISLGPRSTKGLSIVQGVRGHVLQHDA